MNFYIAGDAIIQSTDNCLIYYKYLSSTGILLDIS